ncbi:ATP synthetase [Fasciola gigantica]|uniref:ATP synthetase n=1 Tax=Fasciola gigantica TaxID=46835 RepID=A0A504YB23_FASGI|nr:ATP synthetase [Fasciola gigantica]
MFFRKFLLFGSKLLHNAQPSRRLKIHEYTAMELLQKYDIPVPKFVVVKSLEEVEDACRFLADNTASTDVVVKAQVLAGGRGKGIWDSGLKGGVKIVFTIDEALNLAKRMLGHRIYTAQTGEAGQICNKLIVCERKYSRREHYFAIVLDRDTGGPVMIGCEQGGVNIEEMARDQPDALIKPILIIHKGMIRDECPVNSCLRS